MTSVTRDDLVRTYLLESNVDNRLPNDLMTGDG